MLIHYKLVTRDGNVWTYPILATEDIIACCCEYMREAIKECAIVIAEGKEHPKVKLRVPGWEGSELYEPELKYCPWCAKPIECVLDYKAHIEYKKTTRKIEDVEVKEVRD